MGTNGDFDPSEQHNDKVQNDRRQLLQAIGAVGLGGLATSRSVEAQSDGSSPPEAVDPADYEDSPALTPDEALDTFSLPDGFEIELVASEPVIDSPVDIKWDAEGRLWVVEMPDYMAFDPTDEEGNGTVEDTEWTPEEFEMSELNGWGDSTTDEEPNGRIVVLEDTTGNGRMDQSTVFLDELTLPRNVAFVEGGVLAITDGDLTYCQDTTGDLTCDTQEVLVEDFVNVGNPEHTDNGMVYMMDNWMYNARSDVRLRFRDGELTVDDTHSRGQWGITQDNYGRPYYTWNTTWLMADLVPGEYLLRDSYGSDYGIGRELVDSDEIWTIRENYGKNRAYRDGYHRPDGRMRNVTAVSGPGIYRGDLFDENTVNQAFVPSAQGHAVGRFDIQEDGLDLQAEHLTYDNPEWGQQEFLASTDEVFKPVYVKTGPDGALYVVDMYNGIFQHINFLTDYLAAYYLRNNLHKVPSAGRIYRITPEDSDPNEDVPTLDGLPPAELASYLTDPNGWVRDTAQRLIVQRSMTDAAPTLRQIARSGGVPDDNVSVVGENGRVARHNVAWDPEYFDWTKKPFTDVFDPQTGTRLTSGPDPDRLYEHHRGIFIGWDNLTVNGESYDLWHLDDGSRMIHQSFEDLSDFGSDSTITSTIDWNIPDDDTVIKETRELSFYEAPMDGGIVWIDLTSTLEATGADVELLGDPEHAGIHYRPNDAVADNESAEYVFPEESGLSNDSPSGDISSTEGLPWVGETYTIDGQQYFVQHMNHEDNPADTVYSAYRSYGRFGAFFEETIPAGESLTLEYGFLIKRGGAPSQAALDDYYDAFVGQDRVCQDGTGGNAPDIPNWCPTFELETNLEDGEFEDVGPVPRMHSLWALDGLGEVDAESVFAAMNSPDTHLNMAAMRTGEALLETDSAGEYVDRLVDFTTADHLRRVVQAAYSLGEVADSELQSQARSALEELLVEYPDNQFVIDAVQSSPEMDITVDLERHSAPFGLNLGGYHSGTDTLEVDGLEFQPVTVDAAPTGVRINNVSSDSGAEPDAEVVNTEYDALYRTMQFGSNLGYTIGMENGTYDVTLHLAETYFEEEGDRVFSLSVQGQQAVSDLDLVADAGPLTAKTVTIEDVEVTNGVLEITSQTQVDNTLLNAIEIRSSEPSQTEVSAPFGYNAAGTETDGTVTIDGLEFVAESPAVDATGDASASGSDEAVAPSTTADAIEGTENDLLYQSMQYGGNLSYDVSIENGTYDVTLHFAEIFQTEEAARVFDVSVEGTQVVERLDIYAEAGHDAALTRTVEGVEVTDGTLSIGSTTQTDNSLFSGFEIRSSESDDNVIEPGTTIELGGETPGWIGRAPSSIEGQTNPTLSLHAGETYTVRWENLDGAAHDFYVLDSQGNEIDGTGTELLIEEGATASVEFTATEEMAEYYCSVHPTQMRGDVDVQNGDDDGMSPVVGDSPPTDPDGDGRYEDVNGDGEVNYADVVDLFENFDSAAVQDNPDAFDFNENGHLDFDDIIALFRSL